MPREHHEVDQDEQGNEDQPRGDGGSDTSGGLIIGGSMTGGAIATGRGSTARDSSRTQGGPSPGEFLEPAGLPEAIPPGTTAIAGHVTGGAAATGEDSEAVHEAVRVDPAHKELLRACHQLRRDLGGLVRTDEVAQADAELADVEDEVTRTGRAEPGRLERLRTLLRAGNSVLQAAAGTATVLTAIEGILG